MRRPQKKRIDWAGVHATLAARTTAPAVAALDGARAEWLLSERTRALAAGQHLVPTANQRVLVMHVGPERYALPLAAVREVVEVGRIAALPGARPSVMGIVNWRGEFAMVFDLATVVGAVRSAKPRRAIVLAGAEPPVAVAVDAVEEIVAMDLSALQPAEHLSPQHASLFRGATATALLVFDEAALVERLRKEIRGGVPAAA